MSPGSEAVDQVGAMRLLSPERTLAAVRLVRQGRVYPLGQTLEPGMLQLPGAPPFVRLMVTTPANSRRLRRAQGAQNEPGVASERLELHTHTGTHIDALGHWSNDNRCYGGIDATENCTDQGLVHLGIENCPPLLTRGVLLDLPAWKGVSTLDGGYLITPQDLQGCLSAQGLALGPGDVALLYTGWSHLWDRRDQRYMAAEPGLGREGARWLADQGVVAVGADTYAVDVIPEEDPRQLRVVHQHLLVERGVHLIENLRLQELAADRVYEFLFILLPPRLKGGTAFPVLPVAVI